MGGSVDGSVGGTVGSVVGAAVGSVVGTVVGSCSPAQALSSTVRTSKTLSMDVNFFIGIASDISFEYIAYKLCVSSAWAIGTTSFSILIFQ